jgi:hypothetical protein
MMQSPPPINRWVYCEYGFDDIVSPARLSDSVRVAFIILYRLGLISSDSAMNLVVLRAHLRAFGTRWFTEDRASRSLYKEILRK